MNFQLLPVLLPFAAFVVFYLLFRRKLARALTEKKTHTTREVRYHGHTAYRLINTRAGKGEHTVAIIYEGRTDGTLFVGSRSQLTSFQKLLIRWKLLPTITGDSEFDKSSWIMSEDRRWANDVLRDPVTWEQIKKLHQLGWDLVLAGKELASSRSIGRGEDVPQDQIEEVVTSLSIIAANAARHHGTRFVGLRVPALNFLRILALPLMVLVVSLSLLIPALDDYRTINDVDLYSVGVIPWALPIWLVLLVPGYLAVRRTYNAGYYSLAMGGVLLILSICAGYSARLFLNGYLDDGPAQPRVVRVHSFHVPPPNRGHIFAKVVPWDGTREWKRIPITPEQYDLLSSREQPHLTINIRQGRFGINWFSPDETEPFDFANSA